MSGGEAGAGAGVQVVPRIVLASRSPSRAQLLRAGGWHPELVPADVDEEAIRARLHGAPPPEVVRALATAKAEAVRERIREPQAAIVIGCDSMLLVAGELMGKPHTVERTISRWRAQAGTAGELLTGHCLIGPGGERYAETVATTVHFADAEPADIEAYAATGEPLECAGAFTLEALGGWFIESIEGDPSSVIGLSLPLVRRAVNSFGYPVSSWW